MTSIALIGLGDIAQKAYLPLLATRSDVEPWLCTRDTAVLERLSRQYRIANTFASVREVIARRPDAAMVHSATEGHADLVEALLEAGIPVFVDKPLTYSQSESDRLLRLAARRNVPLMVGFNRRYAPLVSALRGEKDPLQVTWHKNRVDLPGEVRTFVFDDFIHVVDGLRVLAPGPVEDLTVHAQLRDGLLTNLQVRWCSGETLLTGGMNRVSGRTTETIDYHTPGQQWTLHDLHAGVHYRAEERTDLSFNHWTPTLEKRGFVAMIDDWLRISRSPTHDAALAADIRATHALCESIVRRIESRW
ncbi:virulence factor [Lewinella marina]|uniref:Gfo/Idh/MocA family protein n=1 Tax=Neolewinella marina TaxID=438751 RepID=UPI001431C500|nr:Gfo/Idh/MocA family oxidoreductase [Neolewinella marina]NJB84301.1 virulence factor [Neolewinella marina]